MKKTYAQLTLIVVLALSMTVVKRARAQSWSALGTGLDIGACDGSVDALLLFRGELWAGGRFFAPGTGSLINIARWDGANWTSVGGGVDNNVFAMAALNDDRFVAGAFTVAGGVAGFNRIARWNGTAWNTLGSGLNAGVYALASRGTRLYAGGQFTTAGGVTRNRIAYWDTADSSWHSMGVGFPSGTVYAIAVSDNGTVYAGGDFPGTIAWYDEQNGLWIPLQNGPSGGFIVQVRTIVARGAGLDVGGRFTQVGSPPLAVRGLAYWSGTSWFSYPTPPWNPSDATPPGVVRAIAWNGSSQMYVAGALQNTTPSSPMHHIFVLENGVWSTSKPSPGLNLAQCSGEYGRALAVNRFNGRVYVGGYFDTAGGIGSPNVALWTEFKPYQITDLGARSGGTYAYGSAVNNKGESAGSSEVFTNGNFRFHGCWNTGGGTLYDLGGNWSVDDASYVSGINDSSIMVGSIDMGSSGTYVRAFRNALPGTWTLLDPFSGGTRSEGLAINGNNDAVGISRNSSGVDRATRWTASTTVGDDLLTLVTGGGQGFASYAYGINSAGYVIGKSRYSTANTFFHAFRCGPATDIIPVDDDLGTMGGNESIAYAINDVRHVVGTAQNSSGQWRAFLKVPDTGTGLGFIDLGAGGASAINNNSSPQVVGNSFIWKNELGRINLSALLPAGSQWSLDGVEAINDYGQIVGWGPNGGASIHGFIMTP